MTEGQEGSRGSPMAAFWDRMPALVLLVVPALIGGCDVPHDAGNTLEEVRGGSLRVGAIEAPPWVVTREGELGGVEVEIVRRFAEEVGATDIAWSTGSESQLLTALEQRELHLVVGGLTSDTPWKGRVGLTQSYFKSELDIGVPGATQVLPESWAGERMGYPAGEPEIAALVREREAVPLPVDGPADMPAAAPRWQLQGWGLRPTGEELKHRKHVMAVPPGENGFVFRLDRFLVGQEAEIRSRLEVLARVGSAQ